MEAIYPRREAEPTFYRRVNCKRIANCHGPAKAGSTTKIKAKSVILANHYSND